MEVTVYQQISRKIENIFQKVDEEMRQQQTHSSSIEARTEMESINEIKVADWPNSDIAVIATLKGVVLPDLPTWDDKSACWR